MNHKIFYHDTTIDITTRHHNIIILHGKKSTFRNNCLLSILTQGQALSEQFIKQRYLGKTKEFHLCFVLLCVLPVKYLSLLVLRGRASFGQICPGLNANEIQIPYDKRHTEESSLVKNQQNKRSSVKYEVVWKGQIPCQISCTN